MRFFDWLRNWFRRQLPPPTPAPPSVPPDNGSASGILTAVNAARTQYRLSPLTGDAVLAVVAVEHAFTMRSAGILAHSGIGDGTPASRLSAAGVHWSAEGEVIAEGASDARTCVDLWLNSPPHRRILLGDYLRLGAGRAGAYWCANLIRL